MYVPFDVAPGALSAAVDGLRALAVRGVNVTIPHKTTVIPFLDELTPAARAIGAVNTIVNDEGRLIGDNTDGIGFVRSLEEVGFTPRGARVLIVGAGGAARAIAVTLARSGAGRVVIANRSRANAEQLAAAVRKYGAEAAAVPLVADVLRAESAAADVLIQTTPAGMSRSDGAAPFELPLPADALSPSVLVADIVYTPLETPLLAMAARRGCPTVPGWGMLLHQGAEAFSRWTGMDAPVDIMRDVLLHALTAPETRGG